jgi:hypothetical protein
MGSSFIEYSISSFYIHTFSYPSAYIDKQFRKVFGDYISSSSLLPIIDDENQFHQLRRKLMGQPTPRQSQIEAQITQPKQHNENYAEKTTKQTLPSVSNIHQQGKNKLQDNIIIHYTHENRFASMKRDMHEIFREAFKGLGIEAVRLIVGHRNSPTIQRELIRKRPHMKLMTLTNQGNNHIIQTLLFDNTFLHSNDKYEQFFSDFKDNDKTTTKPSQ